MLKPQKICTRRVLILSWAQNCNLCVCVFWEIFTCIKSKMGTFYYQKFHVENNFINFPRICFQGNIHLSHLNIEILVWGQWGVFFFFWANFLLLIFYSLWETCWQSMLNLPWDAQYEKEFENTPVLSSKQAKLCRLRIIYQKGSQSWLGSVDVKLHLGNRSVPGYVLL